MKLPVDNADSQNERSCLILTPDVFKHNPNIQELLISHDFFILHSHESVLNKEQATIVLSPQYSNNTQDINDQIISKITSGPSLCLIVERLNALSNLILLVEEFNTSFNSTNGFLCPTNYSAVDSILSLFFTEQLPVERTLLIFKPDSISHGINNNLLYEIQRRGFTIICKTSQALSRERAMEFYLPSQPKYLDHVSHISSGPIMIFVLSKVAAIDNLIQLVGPEDINIAKETTPFSLRAKYGIQIPKDIENKDQDISDIAPDIVNLIHISHSSLDAFREIHFFFPQLPPSLIPDENAVTSFLKQSSNLSNRSLGMVLVEGLTQLCRNKPRGLDAIQSLAEWLLKNNPNQPFIEEPDQVQTTTLSQRLSRNNDGKKVGITCVLALPDLPKHTLLERLSHSSGYHLYYMKDLLKTAIDNTSEEGQLIKYQINNGLLVSNDIVQNLLTKTLEDDGSTKYIIQGFPRSLEQIISFEKNIGEINQLIFLETSEDFCVKGILARNDKIDAKTAKLIYKEYIESIKVVKEHFQDFSKFQSINMEQDFETTFHETIALL